MTKEEIVEMARQAGFERLGHDSCDYVCYPDEIEVFAKLVAEKERKEWAREFAGMGEWTAVHMREERGQE